MKTYKSITADRVESLANITRIQCSDGNWNCNSYMHGMANGLILALSIIKGEEPPFLSAPKEWLDDKPTVEEKMKVTDNSSL